MCTSASEANLLNVFMLTYFTVMLFMYRHFIYPFCLCVVGLLGPIELASPILYSSMSTLYYEMQMRKLKTKRPLSAASWWTGEWSDCSRSCNSGLQTREVLCKRRISVTEEKVLDDSACTSPRPSLTEPCSNQSCPPEWLALDWSEVSRHQRPSILHVVWFFFYTKLVAKFQNNSSVLCRIPLGWSNSLFCKWTSAQSKRMNHVDLWSLKGIVTLS